MSHHATFHPYNPGQPIGHNFIQLESVDSTNNYAMAQVHAGLALPGTAFFAHEQFAGKGQRGKAWSAVAGQNIIMSVVLQPVFLGINRQFALSACIALACHDLLNRYCPGEISVKWPNDLYWRDRKAGGVLIENILQGNKWQHSIVGTGININQTLFPEHLPNPVSLSLATGKSYNTITLARELCDYMEERYQQMQKQDFDGLFADYNKVLYKINQEVQLKKEGIAFKTLIEGVNVQGHLLTRNGVFDHGEVEWITATN